MDHKILQLYIEGNASQHEKEAVAKWLDADPKHMQEFLLLRNIYDATLWNSDEINDTQTINIVNESIKTPKRKVHLILREVLKVAVVFIIAFGSYYLFLTPKVLSPNVSTQTIYAPEGQRAEVILSDGSQVWINARSSLTFPTNFDENQRTVELDGEAYFNVAHDDTKKFIVNTSKYQIKVHGTEFNVKAYGSDDLFETSLIQGSVEVFSKKSDESILLSPNERVYAENDKLILTRIDSPDHFLWKQGILFFENQTVEEIFKEIELYYDVDIEVKNKSILIHQYTGKFWIKDGVDHVLRVLQLRHNFEYTKDGLNKIVIY